MDRIKDYIITKGGNEMGVTVYDIQNNILTPTEFEEFNVFMAGQTSGFLDNSCTSNIIYTGDLLRFITKNT